MRVVRSVTNWRRRRDLGESDSVDSGSGSVTADVDASETKKFSSPSVREAGWSGQAHVKSHVEKTVLARKRPVRARSRCSSAVPRLHIMVSQGVWEVFLGGGCCGGEHGRVARAEPPPRGQHVDAQPSGVVGAEQAIRPQARAGRPSHPPAHGLSP